MYILRVDFNFVTLLFQLYAYNAATGEREKTLSHCDSAAHCCAFRHDGALLVYGDGGGLVHLIDAHVPRKGTLKVIQAHDR